MLLGLYPADFRAQFGEEMAAVFEQAAAERRPRGGACLLLFLVKEMMGLVAGAAKEHAFRDHSVRSYDDLPFPSDVAGAERYIAVISRRIIHAIANHEFEKARHYDLQDRKARALLAQLRGQ
jgi:hypothetical protein